MDDMAADYCCALHGVILVLGELALLFFVFTFWPEFVFSFTIA